MPDLIRSKETEREIDWQDISFLEEVFDRRNITAAKSGEDVVLALSRLRSVRGLELAMSRGFLAHQQNVEAALKDAANPITQSFLLPFAPEIAEGLPPNDILPAPFRKHLQLVQPASSRHLAIVEAVRLRYKRAMQELDRKEKDEHRKRQEPERL